MHSRYGRAPRKDGNWLRVKAPIFWAYVKMLRRLESEERLAAANLAFATEGQAMDDMDRATYLGELQMGANPRQGQASYEDMEQAGIAVIYEDAEGQPVSAGDADA